MSSSSAPRVVLGILVVLALAGGGALAWWQFLRPRQLSVVGDWSEWGNCDRSRFRFRADGGYESLKLEGQQWQLVYQGVYVAKEEGLIIAENLNTGGFALKVDKLTDNELVGEMESYPVKWVRCN